jgi:hypothetical protein
MSRNNIKIIASAAVIGVVLVVVAGWIVLAYFAPGGRLAYRRFQQHDGMYYLQFTHDCDQLLRQHPTFSRYLSSGPNVPNTRVAWTDGDNITWNYFRIAGKDQSLPPSIHDLHPSNVLLAPDRVWIRVGSIPGFSIVWAKGRIQTNMWTLVTTGKGYETPLYSEIR